MCAIYCIFYFRLAYETGVFFFCINVTHILVVYATFGVCVFTHAHLIKVINMVMMC